jgi:hypothetical protein
MSMANLRNTTKGTDLAKTRDALLFSPLPSKLGKKTKLFNRQCCDVFNSFNSAYFDFKLEASWIVLINITQYDQHKTR